MSASFGNLLCDRPFFSAVILVVVHRMCEPSRACLHYTKDSLSRLCHALPLLEIGRPQRGCIESLNRVVLRFCLGVPLYSVNIVTLTKKVKMLLEHRAEEMALHHLHRLRTHSHIGCHGQSISPTFRHSWLGSPSASSARPLSISHHSGQN